MLLLHQTGGVKVGEVVRYTVSYTPSRDYALPPPDRLYVRVRNTSSATLRAAIIAGPFTLSVCAYPSIFSPFKKLENPRSNGVPQFEPMVKAGANWKCDLRVPDHVREAATDPHLDNATVSWVIEVSSQIIFTMSAVVGYEVMVATDPESLKSSLSPSMLMSSNPPAKLAEHQAFMRLHGEPSRITTQGVFSKALSLKVEDTAMLWNSPPLLSGNGPKTSQDQLEDESRTEMSAAFYGTANPHATLGQEKLETSSLRYRQMHREADHYLDTRARGHDNHEPNARNERTNGHEPRPRRKTKDTERGEARKQKKVHLVIVTHGLHSNIGADMLFLKESIDGAAKQAKLDARARRARERAARRGSGREQREEDSDSDDEEVIVRGYSRNATMTQRGIKFLGKRVAKYVLSMTYPDQPYLPTGKTVDEGFAQGIAGDHHHHHHRAHQYMPHEYRDRQRRSYKMTSISFVGHSLGGPVQTFAIAYIQKHCPDFFDLIKPRNFITLASPLLGVSNENPLYVRFALESGLVGRSGRDLGLSWGPKTVARSGWDAFVGSKTRVREHGNERPEAKPLLRILPTGPAHTALRKFSQRTVYANIVNDGIVPLRTSSLLFLDWQSIERVDRARREAGLIESAVAIGWHEIMGNNLVTPGQREWKPSRDSVIPEEALEMVPLPSNQETKESEGPTGLTPATALVADATMPSHSGYTANVPFAGLFSLFKTNAKDPREEKFISRKHKQMLSRGQTFSLDEMSSTDGPGEPGTPREGENGFRVPPATSFLEGVGDVLNPAVADVNFLINPRKRPKTIFHDRVYQPSDIPPAPAQRQRNMLVEERIARSYHRDMPWRKVLVKLEPDAHNNIAVRRMFVNSYGWPVIEHLVNTHFSDAAVVEANRQEARPEHHDADLALDDDILAQFEALRKLRRLQVDQPGRAASLGLQHQAGLQQAPIEPDEASWYESDWVDSADESDEDEGRFKAMRGNMRANRSDKGQTWHSPGVDTWEI